MKNRPLPVDSNITHTSRKCNVGSAFSKGGITVSNKNCHQYIDCQHSGRKKVTAPVRIRIEHTT